MRDEVMPQRDYSKSEYPEAGSNTCGIASQAACRQSARDFLQAKIHTAARELRQMEALHASLPEAMIDGADMALWTLLSKS